MAPTDIELIQQAQRGDMKVFEQLVQRYDEHVLTMALTYVNDHDDAKDIYQDVFLRVYKGLPKFQFRSEFSTWLYRIATNVCLSHLSKRKHRTHMSLDQELKGDDERTDESLTSEIEADQHAINSEIAIHVEGALDTLSPQQKLVFTLRHYDGYKLKEIASMMDCAEGTVKKYLFTAIQRMRKQLEGIYNN